MEPNAVQDILEGARFEGMIDTIRPVTDAVDIVFTTVITFVAFFIISVALLRNVLAGAYCAFPKFWEQVAKAHEENDDKAFFSAITGIKDSYKTASMSSVRTALLRLVPNIKNLTDFEDNTLSPKAYFIKAIPQMIAVVIIGVFIYNGYYRDAVSIVASTGSEIIERTVLSFDPMGAFDTIMNTAGRPDFATDNAVTALDKNKNKVATEIYSQIISKYTDIKDANSKADLAKEIDEAVDAIFGTNDQAIDGLTKYFSAEDGSYAVTTRVEIVKDFDPKRYTSTKDPDRVQFCWKLGLGREDNITNGAMHDGSQSGAPALAIAFDSTTDAAKNEQWYVRVMAKATRNAVKTTSTQEVHVNITVAPTSGKDNAIAFGLTPGSSLGGIVGEYNGVTIIAGDNAGFKIYGGDGSGDNGHTYPIGQRFVLKAGDQKSVDVIIDNVIVKSSAATAVTANDDYVRYYNISYSGGALTATKLDNPTGGPKTDNQQNDDAGDNDSGDTSNGDTNSSAPTGA